MSLIKVEHELLLLLLLSVDASFVLLRNFEDCSAEVLM